VRGLGQGWVAVAPAVPPHVRVTGRTEKRTKKQCKFRNAGNTTALPPTDRFSLTLQSLTGVGSYLHVQQDLPVVPYWVSDT
jgi:hypothetical protein